MQFTIPRARLTPSAIAALILFVSTGDSPHLIKDFPFVLERKRLLAAIDAVDNQIVVAADNAREQ